MYEEDKEEIMLMVNYLIENKSSHEAAENICDYIFTVIDEYENMLEFSEN